MLLLINRWVMNSRHELLSLIVLPNIVILQNILLYEREDRHPRFACGCILRVCNGFGGIYSVSPSETPPQ